MAVCSLRIPTAQYRMTSLSGKTGQEKQDCLLKHVNGWKKEQALTCHLPKNIILLHSQRRNGATLLFYNRKRKHINRFTADVSAPTHGTIHVLHCRASQKRRGMEMKRFHYARRPKRACSLWLGEKTKAKPTYYFFTGIPNYTGH